jgi:hypothetical protein
VDLLFGRQAHSASDQPNVFISCLSQLLCTRKVKPRDRHERTVGRATKSAFKLEEDFVLVRLYERLEASISATPWVTRVRRSSVHAWSNSGLTNSHVARIRPQQRRSLAWLYSSSLNPPIGSPDKSL